MIFLFVCHACMFFRHLSQMEAIGTRNGIAFRYVNALKVYHRRHVSRGLDLGVTIAAGLGRMSAMRWMRNA
jgi:hypothetical protein